MPKGWLIPKALADQPRFAAALDRLRWHGIRIEEVAADAQVAVERFSIAEMTKAPKPFQGHQEARLEGHVRQGATDRAGRVALRPGRISRWRGWRSICSSRKATMAW